MDLVERKALAHRQASQGVGQRSNRGSGLGVEPRLRELQQETRVLRGQAARVAQLRERGGSIDRFGVPVGSGTRTASERKGSSLESANRGRHADCKSRSNYYP